MNRPTLTNFGSAVGLAAALSLAVFLVGPSAAQTGAAAGSAREDIDCKLPAPAGSEWVAWQRQSPNQRYIAKVVCVPEVPFEPSGDSVKPIPSRRFVVVDDKDVVIMAALFKTFVDPGFWTPDSRLFLFSPFDTTGDISYKYDVVSHELAYIPHDHVSLLTCRGHSRLDTGDYLVASTRGYFALGGRYYTEMLFDVRFERIGTLSFYSLSDDRSIGNDARDLSKGCERTARTRLRR